MRKKKKSTETAATKTLLSRTGLMALMKYIKASLRKAKKKVLSQLLTLQGRCQA